MIVSSFQTQYGIRLASDLPGMSWQEFSYLLQGISGETPLGHIIAIRAETDPEAIRRMTPQEKRIRSEYRRRAALQKSNRETENALESMKNAFINMAT